MILMITFKDQTFFDLQHLLLIFLLHMIMFIIAFLSITLNINVLVIKPNEQPYYQDFKAEFIHLPKHIIYQ
jgi:hypothetical protein